MRKLVVAFDVDGVFVDYNTGFRRCLELLGATLTPFEDGRDPTSWNWYHRYGASQSQVEAALTFTRDNPSFWEDLPIHRDLTGEALDHLAKVCRGHETYVVTSRPKGMGWVTEAWLWDRLHAQGSVVVCPGDKVGALASIDPDVVVEDNALTLLRLAALTRPAHRRLLLVKRAYNREHWVSELVPMESTAAALQEVSGGIRL